MTGWVCFAVGTVAREGSLQGGKWMRTEMGVSEDLVEIGSAEVDRKGLIIINYNNLYCMYVL